MKLALSAISTFNASFAEDVAAYAAAGFDSIGLWEFKLPADDDANRELLREHGLGVANCVPLVPSILQLGIPGLEGPADPELRIEAICDALRRFAPYAPECVVCLTGPLGGHALDEARSIVIDGLRRIAAVGDETGARLGLEPIHPAERDTTSWINTVAAAVDLLDEAGLDHVGIMADTYNLWDDGDAAAWLAANPGRRQWDACRRPSRRHGGPRPARGGGPAREGARRRSPFGRLARLARRRDLLDAGRLLGAAGRRSRTPRTCGRMCASLGESLGERAFERVPAVRQHRLAVRDQHPLHRESAEARA